MVTAGDALPSVDARTFLSRLCQGVFTTATLPDMAIDVSGWPLWRSTRYAEAIPESPEESITRDAMRVQRAIYVLWASRYQAVRDFVGWPELRVVPTPFISRVTPHRHPACPIMVCTGCSRIQPWRPTGLTEDPILGPVARYDLAKLYLTYEATLYDVREDPDQIGTSGHPCDVSAAGTLRYVIPLFVPGGKFLVHPRGWFKWAEGTAAILGKTVTLEAPRFIPEGELVLNWLDTPAYPLQAVLNLSGRINDAPFLGFPTGTLLFNPSRQRPTISPHPNPPVGAPSGGIRTYDVPYIFKYLPNCNKAGVAKGHNALLMNDGGNLDYFYPTASGALGGDRMHRTGDFNRLFRPDPP